MPAGDIGVGGREIGYMFGQYKRITNQFTGVLTGKGARIWRLADPPRGDRLWRGLFPREHAEDARARTWPARRAVISGSGNVATHAAEKIVQLGGKVLTLSDSEGFIHDPDGITQEKIDWVKAHKTRRRGRISRICRRVQGRDLPRRQDALGRRLRRGAALRDPERAARRRCAHAGHRTAASRSPKAPTCRPTSKACTSSRTRRCSTRRARPPMPAASPSRASR